MKEKKKLIVLAMAFALLLAAASVIYDIFELNAASGGVDGQWGSGNTEKVSAPDFTVYDIDGNAVQLSDFIGKPIVVNFWASWCGPCRDEMPDFDAAYEKMGEKVYFLMVNMTSGRETLKSASSFAEEQAFSFPVYYDTKSDASEAYGITSLPTTVFIDAEGYVAGQVIGAINGAALQMGIDMILPE